MTASTDLKLHRLFISHAWQYNKDYYNLEKMLNAAENFSWDNYSVPEHNPKDANNERALKEALRNQITPTNCVLIISGMYVKYRKWIQYEIDLATEGFKKPKPIIGIRPRGSERIPKEVSEIANEMVGWSTSSIVNAIRRHTP